MYNKDNNSKRSNSSSKNESERSKNSNKNELNSKNEEDLNKVSNRSENGSDTIKNDSNRVSNHNEDKTEKMDDNETNRTNETLPEKPSLWNSMCGNSSSKKKINDPIIEVDEGKDEFISALTNYFDSEGFKQSLEGIERKKKAKFKEYIDRFENSNNYDETKKIDTKQKLVCKVLNYFKELIKDSNKYGKFKNDIMSKYHSIYKNEDDDEVNFSFNENDNDISQIEINTNDLSQMRVNTNESEYIPPLDFSALDNEVTNRNQINEENKEDGNKKPVEKIDQKEGYGAVGAVVYNYYKQTKDQVATKVNEYFKSKSNENKNDGLDNEYHKTLRKKFESMKENDEFVQLKGGTLEEDSNNYNPDINQNVLTNTQLNNEEVVEDYSCPQYVGYASIAAIAVCLIAQALNYMSDHHDYHGFGPSGF